MKAAIEAVREKMGWYQGFHDLGLRARRIQLSIVPFVSGEVMEDVGLMVWNVVNDQRREAPVE
jgi:hypothetical protein